MTTPAEAPRTSAAVFILPYADTAPRAVPLKIATVIVALLRAAQTLRLLRRGVLTTGKLVRSLVTPRAFNQLAHDVAAATPAGGLDDQ